MSRDEWRTAGRQQRRDVIDYEPPQVERVLTPAELEREVLYAGDTTGVDQ